MSALAIHPLAVGYDTPAVGDTAQRVKELTECVVIQLRAGGSARSSAVFNDLNELANELGSGVARSALFGLGKQFLLALPSDLSSPELAVDDDGDLVFDWAGRNGELLTVALGEDGLLSYAARISEYDKEHGTKLFAGALPQNLLDLVQRVCG